MDSLLGGGSADGCPPAAWMDGACLPACLQVGNASKQKWLHALGMSPSTEMTPEQLTAVPEGTSPCPFEIASRKRGADAMAADEARLGVQDWRWQQRGGKRQQGQQKGERAPVAAPSLGARWDAAGAACVVVVVLLLVSARAQPHTASPHPAWVHLLMHSHVACLPARPLAACWLPAGRKDVVKDKKKTCFARNVPFRCSHSTCIFHPRVLPPAAPSNAAAAAGVCPSASSTAMLPPGMLPFAILPPAVLLINVSMLPFVLLCFQGDRGGPCRVLLPVRHSGGCRAAAQCRGCVLPRRRPHS